MLEMRYKIKLYQTPRNYILLCYSCLSGLSVGVISNANSIVNLGLHLGPALAAGYNVVLQVGTKITPCAFLLAELATKVG